MKKTITSLLLFLPLLISAQESTSTSGSDDSEKLIYIVVIVAVLWVFFKIFKFFHSRKCPFCKKKMALKLIDEQFLGVTKTKREKQSDGSYATVHYNKMKYVKQCKYCGGIVNEIRIVKGDTE